MPTLMSPVRKLRNHGSDARNVHSYGFNSRLDDLHAGILSAKLKHIDEYNDARRKWSARYNQGPQELPDLRPAGRAEGLSPRLPPLRHRDQKPEWRDQLVDFLVKNGVDAKTHYSIAIQTTAIRGQKSPHRRQRRQRRGQRRLLRQPPDVPRITAEEVDYVVAKLKEWDKQFAAQAPAGKGPAQSATAVAVSSPNP